MIIPIIHHSVIIYVFWGLMVSGIFQSSLSIGICQEIFINYLNIYITVERVFFRSGYYSEFSKFLNYNFPEKLVIGFFVLQ